MIDENCGTCDFGRTGGKSIFCHRFPPMPFPLPTQQTRIIGQRPNVSMGQICFFPVVGKNDWCGEWRHNDS